MKATPMFLGACALASIAGAVGGATTNTTPIQRGGIGSEMLPERYFAFDASDTGLAKAPALPDHYPVRTPEGRIEVAELSTRGLYSQQRFGWRETAYEPPSEELFGDLSPDWTEPAAQGEFPALAELADPVAVPVPVLDIPQTVTASSNGSVSPRVIDVAATLAARN